MFLILLNHEISKQTKFPSKKNNLPKFSKTQQEELSTALLHPDLAIFDEGHKLRTPHSQIYRLADKIDTKLRIILSGTPLQNSLSEFYWLVNFIKPHLLGNFKQFGKFFIDPIINGQGKEASKYQIDSMKRRAYVLQRLLNSCMHRRDYSVYETILPPKKEFVIHVQLTTYQLALYKVRNHP